MSISDMPRQKHTLVSQAVVGCLVVAGLLSANGTALAQTEKNPPAAEKADATASDGLQEDPSVHEAMAMQLFDEARLLMTDGRYAQACEKFEASLAIVQGVGTEFNLANCYEKVEHKVKAHALFFKVAKATKAAGEVQRSELAFARAHALESELGSLRIRLANATKRPKVEVLVDDEPLPRGFAKQPHFVEPGEHSVRANAPGKRDWSDTIRVAAGEQLTVRVPNLVPIDAAEEKSASDPNEDLDASGLDETADGETAGNGWAWVPPVTLGVGAIGLFAGVAYTQQYRASHADARAVCPSSFACTPEEVERHEDLVDESRRARTRAAIGYSVAATALGTTIAVYLWGPKQPSESASVTSLRLDPLLAKGFGGASMLGTF